MTLEIANKLNALSGRLESVMNRVESGEIKPSDEVDALVDDLENKVSAYEDILEQEKKMS
jgi:translation elongation factor EF-1alpha